MLSLAVLSAFIGVALAAPASRSCVGTISSLSDIANATQCTTVDIESFTVPAGEGFTLSLLNGTTVNLKGDVAFGNLSWAGPLFTISGYDITFNGNGYKFDGGGPFYWDGLGSNGGTIKPRPMLKIKISGTLSNLDIVNSPCQVFSVTNPGPLVIDAVNIDNSQGDYPNANSSGLPAGHNTDGFDVSTTDLTIQNSVVKNQDDCIAINRGSNINFLNNYCSGGHGISIGSIVSDVVVTDIVVAGNTIVNEDQAIRIKTDATATNSTVSNITYSGNHATGLRKFGILIDQSYPATLGTPGNGVIISGVNFVGPESTFSVNTTAKRAAVNCGAGSCTGTWDWSQLTITGGVAGPENNFTGITGFTF
ncbi:glycoside hydrolase family 28 protein [Jaapia argillacea MUCL 33604]|uniref:endo-polygalacturonase n=1 Tax=Jaapia argillacea MUCL 33604 TaxID=933084 RepID=A0A067PS81_9AGAM|nr:glycoside hydrolase family 28 protein [Jaapia argillacea MUCL 33604]